jgi:hypothetical protein
VSNPVPSDSWYENSLAYIVFDLHPDASSAVAGATRTHALFVLSLIGQILAARIIEQSEEADGTNLLDLLA